MPHGGNPPTGAQTIMDPNDLIDAIARWAKGEAMVRAVALVGSHARESARPGSDVDVVILCSQPKHYLFDLQWLSTFGDIRRTAIEDWGEVQSVRVFYAAGPEVEFGIASVNWMAVPLDAGTKQVLADGARVVFDRDGRLTEAIESVRRSA
jgi:predicted nucleotidyltransferase